MTLVAAALATTAVACGMPGAPSTPGSGLGSTGHMGTPLELSGSLPDGATWKATVPEEWSGTLLLYSHGYMPGVVPGPPQAQIAPDAPTQRALLDRGYALVGSSYSQNGWAVGTAAQDQLDALAAVKAALRERRGREPSRVLAYGTSMGGLVTGQLAERAGDVIDGALPTCGLMAGGVGLVNYQLDGSHAINQLLARRHDVDLVGYATLAEANAAATALTAAVETGQRSEEGRARVALAAALFHLPRWRSGEPPPSPGNLGASQEGMYLWLKDTLGFVQGGRYDIETEAGGNPSWNAGVDYRQLFQQSRDRWLVSQLYRRADLDLDADLDRLTQTATVEADPAALEWQEQHSTLSGQLALPVLSLHTKADNLAPVQYEEEYREEVRRAGNQSLLRQAFVARPGHCAFTPAELVASILALDQRVETGDWGELARPARLDAAADQLHLGHSEIVVCHPGEFLGDRGIEPPPPPTTTTTSAPSPPTSAPTPPPTAPGPTTSVPSPPTSGPTPSTSAPGPPTTIPATTTTTPHHEAAAG